MSATMDQDQVKLLIREGEGLTTEFKERYTSRIDEDIVALANARGGNILLGVRDDGTVTGERLTNELKARINSLARNCKPGLSVELAQVGEVVTVGVPEGSEKPYSCGSGYYRRLNGTTQKMSHDELRIMFAENDPLPYEVRTVRRFAFADISREKIRAFTREADIHVGHAAIPDFLRSLNVADETRVRNAGILFFARDVHRHILHAETTLLAFKGTDRLHIYDRLDVRDDLLTQFDEAVAFLKKHLNVRSEIRGLDRKDIYEIPLEVLREAVVNALMHRDYSMTGTQVFVEVHDDRVEIVNPGALPKGLSVRELGTVSIRRNQIIADLFSRLHKVERTGMGIRKMKEAMRKAGLPKPEFHADTFFRAVFYRSPEYALKETTGEKTREKTREKRVEKILALLRSDPSLTTADLAQATSLTVKGVEWNLKKLKDAGRIRRVGPDKGGYWEVVDMTK